MSLKETVEILFTATDETGNAIKGVGQGLEDLSAPAADLTKKFLLLEGAILAIGAAFDFHAGVVRQARKFMQLHGLEWLFRLAVSPKRLVYRYLVYNPLFVINILLQLTRIRQYQINE